MMTKLRARVAVGLTALSGLLVAGTARAATPSVDDVVTSSTAAITDAGGTVLQIFFAVLPYILLFVIPIAIVLWGVHWLMAHFKGGKKR